MSHGVYTVVSEDPDVGVVPEIERRALDGAGA